ncbi:unnamed protein product [Darwinula stevensoni]|uniref:serine--tRNA ligase n=1 Tax=Darwinula stevensoni TaxID=69355 RepID=A0A7R8ZX68_9CRUS|nr:unnamed protein product [Darwinula stevensoni]CAG0878826.1 unnamed protein product [Darwinula stevensoni]
MEGLVGLSSRIFDDSRQTRRATLQMTWLQLRYLLQMQRGRGFGFLSRAFGSKPTAGGLALPEEPDLDLEYVLEPGNAEEITENIRARKERGDIREVTGLYERWQRTKDEASRDAFYAEAKLLPNRLSPRVSHLTDEPEVLESFGGKPEFAFAPKRFEEIGKKLDGFRTDSLGKVSGQRAHVIRGSLALLEWALLQYSLAVLRAEGFSLVSVPDLLHPRIVEACGFPADLQRGQARPDSSPVCLSGTSEMGIGGLLAGRVFSREDLPLRLAAVSRCFRAEVSDTHAERGLYRVHHFTKVEMFCVGENSGEILEELVRIQKRLFEPLGLWCRVLRMPPSDLGPSAAEKIDVEAWMPGHGFFGEISSASSCTDYQARRLGLRLREDGKHPETGNGTACAIPRLLIALAETHQRRDGTVRVPEPLASLLGGVEVLEKPKVPLKLHWLKNK